MVSQWFPELPSTLIYTHGAPQDTPATSSGTPAEPSADIQGLPEEPPKALQTFHGPTEGFNSFSGRGQIKPEPENFAIAQPQNTTASIWPGGMREALKLYYTI